MGTIATLEESRITDGPRRSDRPSMAKSGSWLCLGAAAVLMLFANGKDTIWLAAWLAPVFLLRFVRSQSKKIGLPFAYGVLVAAFAFQFRGMVPIPGVAFYIFLVLYGSTLLVPYLLDRLVAHRLTGIATSLVFPMSWVATEYILSFGPYATWGSAAYSQYGNLALLQLLSVTGLWGITFLIGWFAAVCSWLWEAGLDCGTARRGAWLIAGTIATVAMLGGARMAIFPPSFATVRVASLSRRELGGELSQAVVARLFEGKSTAEDVDSLRRWAAAADNDLLTRAEREMQAGAKIVFWGETNADVLKEDELALVARGGELAAKHQAYLGMAVGVLRVGETPPFENKLVLIQPDGKVAWEYNKARPVPGGEAASQVRGDGKLREVDTPYGRLSAVICYDGDFPQLLAQAGALGADVVLDPSNDWRAIDPWHTQMASYRAIEQGFNLIRHTSKGLAAAFDYQGHRLAAMDHYESSDYAMISDVPTKGVRTVYSRLGDWAAWLCMAGLLYLTVKSLRPKHA